MKKVVDFKKNPKILVLTEKKNAFLQISHNMFPNKLSVV